MNIYFFVLEQQFLKIHLLTYTIIMHIYYSSMYMDSVAHKSNT